MKDMNYIQMPLSLFLYRFPEYKELFPSHVFNDIRYVVRLQPDKGLMEVGFPEDRWKIT